MQPEGYSYWFLKIDGANAKEIGEGGGNENLRVLAYQKRKQYLKNPYLCSINFQISE